MKLCIDIFAGTITRVMILFEKSGRFVTLYRRRKAVKGLIDYLGSEEYFLQCQREKVMDEYLRGEIKRGLEEYENERRGIPKWYTCNFPPSSRVHVSDEKGSGISCCNGGKGGHSQ